MQQPNMPPLPQIPPAQMPQPQQPAPQVPPEMMAIGPELVELLKAQKAGQQQPGMQQLAMQQPQNAMGALGYAMGSYADAYNKKQQNAAMAELLKNGNAAA